MTSAMTVMCFLEVASISVSGRNANKGKASIPNFCGRHKSICPLQTPKNFCLNNAKRLAGCTRAWCLPRPWVTSRAPSPLRSAGRPPPTSRSTPSASSSTTITSTTTPRSRPSPSSAQWSTAGDLLNTQLNQKFVGEVERFSLILNY